MEKMTRKAVFFTIVSLFVVILFVAGSSLVSEFRIGESEMEVTRTKVRVFNSVVQDMQQVYFSKILYISSKNALEGLSEYYYANDFDNIEYELPAALAMLAPIGEYTRRNGNVISLVNLSYMDARYTVSGQMRNISKLLNNLGIVVEYLDIGVIDAKQIGPWTIEVTGEIDYYFRDEKGTASWKGFTTTAANISIYGIYLFDYSRYPSSLKMNAGRVNSSWIQDTAVASEPSAMMKLSGRLDKTDRLGICSPYFLIEDRFDPDKICNCRNDSLCTT